MSNPVRGNVLFLPFNAVIKRGLVPLEKKRSFSVDGDFEIFLFFF